MDQPFVSCIMPTANRQKYIPFAIANFQKQDYPFIELIIVDDGKESIIELLPDDERIRYFHTDTIGSIGKKRNYACEKSTGEIIMHMDDDDWYAADWVTKQVNFLLTSKADLCGIEHINYFSPVSDTLWKGTSLNRNTPYRQQWLSGATLAYWRKFWEQHPFEDKSIAEDDNFIKNPGAKVFAHDYIDGFIALLHSGNTTPKYFELPKMKRRQR